MGARLQPTLVFYETESGRCPFLAWIRKLRNVQARAVINSRLTRLESGLLGDTKSLGSGLYELRVDIGPGYRVYYAPLGETIILLLCGGDKSTQSKDIARARMYLKDHRNRDHA